MTLTTRLSWFFLSALAAVLVAFSTTLYLLADRYLHRQIDHRLESTARTLAAGVEVDPDGAEWEPAGRSLAFGQSSFGNDVRWVVSTDAGQAVDQSGTDGIKELLSESETAFRTGHRNPRRLEFSSAAWQVTRVRLAPETLPAAGVGKGKHAALVITVASPLAPVHSTLRTLAGTLAGLTMAVLLAAFFTCRWVCRGALAPVARMADAARTMGAADLSERLPVPASRDELSHLGRAFNDLLDRLGEAFERERQFAGEASHQLRTPLAALIGHVEVALRRERSTEEYQRVLQTVLGQSQRLQRVVEALLFLARSEGAGLTGFETIDLTHWVEKRLLASNENARSADLAFESATGGPVPANIHPDLFGELFDALVDNALKYSSSGTQVVVRTGTANGDVWVEVEDRGGGVAPEDVPHLFRPFFRADSARKLGIPGAGLGLAVASRIATAHGGSISVDSAPRRGTRFRVHLPESENLGRDSITVALGVRTQPSGNSWGQW
jgi:heavy metal sensor kinase